jgi:hypothetical protein
LIYDFLVTSQDPLLKIWNIQNQTPSPPLLDLVISLSPVVFIAVIGVVVSYKSQERPIRLLILWAVLGVVLLYIPWGLQRRFILGYYIPLCALAAAGLGTIVNRQASFVFAAVLITVLAIPTNLVIGMSSFQAINDHDSAIYLSKGEADALDWIGSHTPLDAIIVAAPDTGLFIPAYTGRRVFYGHPYETVDAAFQRGRVTRFFEGDTTIAEDRDLLAEADYVFFGPREVLIDGYTPSPKLELAYATQDVQIFHVIDH